MFGTSLLADVGAGAIIVEILVIIGIIAVGAFLIVLISDLIMFLLDESKGIFFGKSRGAYTGGRPKLLTKNKDQQELAYNYDNVSAQDNIQASAVQSSAAVQNTSSFVSSSESTDSRSKLIEQRKKDYEEPKPEKSSEDIDKILSEIFDDGEGEDEDADAQKPAAAEPEPKVVEKAVVDDKLVKENEQLVNRINELEDRLAEGEDIISDLESKLDNAGTGEDEQLVTEIATLREKLNKTETTITELKEQLNAANNAEPVVNTVYKTVVKGDADEINDRLAVLRERLRLAEKELRTNNREYLPLRRVANTLDSDKKKLRRKEAIVAKQKVQLYGVNNYVDIDEEKAKKLAEDLDLLEGLRLSVAHCEEVMAANKDRYPVLERTNRVLTISVTDLKADIAELEEQLKKLLADKN